MSSSLDQFEWQERAACRGIPSYIFFPEEQLIPGFKPDPSLEGVTYKDICRSCAVKYKCLRFGNLHNLQGIWGGLTDRERRRNFGEDDRDELKEILTQDRTYFPLAG